MSSNEMYMDPKEYEKQVSGFQSAQESFSSQKYEIEDKGLRLECVEKLVDCCLVYQDAMKAFDELMKMDIQSFKVIKSDWLHMDESRGTKTAFEHIQSAFSQE